jgi:hypothetical protein
MSLALIMPYLQGPKQDVMVPVVPFFAYRAHIFAELSAKLVHYQEDRSHREIEVVGQQIHDPHLRYKKKETFLRNT